MSVVVLPTSTRMQSSTRDAASRADATQFVAANSSGRERASRSAAKRAVAVQHGRPGSAGNASRTASITNSTPSRLVRKASESSAVIVSASGVVDIEPELRGHLPEHLGEPLASAPHLERTHGGPHARDGAGARLHARGLDLDAADVPADGHQRLTRHRPTPLPNAAASGTGTAAGREPSRHACQMAAAMLRSMTRRSPTYDVVGRGLISISQQVSRRRAPGPRPRTLAVPGTSGDRPLCQLARLARAADEATAATPPS